MHYSTVDFYAKICADILVDKRRHTLRTIPELTTHAIRDITFYDTPYLRMMVGGIDSNTYHLLLLSLRPVEDDKTHAQFKCFRALVTDPENQHMRLALKAHPDNPELVFAEFRFLNGCSMAFHRFIVQYECYADRRVPIKLRFEQTHVAPEGSAEIPATTSVVAFKHPRL